VTTTTNKWFWPKREEEGRCNQLSYLFVVIPAAGTGAVARDDGMGMLAAPDEGAG